MTMNRMVKQTIALSMVFFCLSCEISGTITEDSVGVGDVTVTLSGDADMTTKTDAWGYYSFRSIGLGTYFITPSENCSHFEPEHQEVLIENFFEKAESIDFSGSFDPGETKLTASDSAADDIFGVQVSISGDYAIAGASRDDDFGASSGSAYVFMWSGGTWNEQVKLTASDSAADDGFGYPVSISEEYAAVGASGDDDNGSSSGSAYVFVRNGSAWTEQAKLTASDGAVDDYFGSSISISGDYAVVGALWDDDYGHHSGSAYVFVRGGSAWTEQAKLTASDGAAEDEFGYSVSISGDYAIVGAYKDDDSGHFSGSAYVFVRSGGTWAEQVKLTASDGDAYDYFGRSVSISGDQAIVGAPGADGNGSSSGSAYLFVRSGSTWNEQVELSPSDGAAGDGFGRSVSISGDHAVVGAYLDRDNGASSGSVYVFVRTENVWSEKAKLTASDGAANDNFGYSAAISGDNVIVGAPAADGIETDSGSAYIYECILDH